MYIIIRLLTHNWYVDNMFDIEREMIQDLPRKCPKQTENWLPKCWHSFYHCFPPPHPRKRSKMTQHVAAHPTPLKPRLNPIESDGPTHGHRVPHGACYRWHPGAGKLNSVPGRWAQNSEEHVYKTFWWCMNLWNRLCFGDVFSLEKIAQKNEEYTGWRILKMTKCQFWEMEWIKLQFCSCLRLIQYTVYKFKKSSCRHTKATEEPRPKGTLPTLQLEKMQSPKEALFITLPTPICSVIPFGDSF